MSWNFYFFIHVNINKFYSKKIKSYFHPFIFLSYYKLIFQDINFQQQRYPTKRICGNYWTEEMIERTEEGLEYIKRMKRGCVWSRAIGVRTLDLPRCSLCWKWLWRRYTSPLRLPRSSNSSPQAPILGSASLQRFPGPVIFVSGSASHFFPLRVMGLGCVGRWRLERCLWVEMRSGRHLRWNRRRHTALSCFSRCVIFTADDEFSWVGHICPLVCWACNNTSGCACLWLVFLGGGWNLTTMQCQSSLVGFSLYSCVFVCLFFFFL